MSSALEREIDLEQQAKPYSSVTRSQVVIDLIGEALAARESKRGK